MEMQGKKGYLKLHTHVSLQAKATNALVISLHLVTVSTLRQTTTSLEAAAGALCQPRKLSQFPLDPLLHPSVCVLVLVMQHQHTD